MTRIILIACTLMMTTAAKAQPYVSYLVGDAADVVTVTTAGTVLMGGAGENDNAVRWFLQRAGGGDVLVLRTTGEDGYNDYFYSDLDVTVNSVETIVCTGPASGSDPYVVQQIQNAEAIWFAGGDQWEYISYWRDTPAEDALNAHIQVKQAPIGGTSAGCAIQGEAYFSAENGTITSTQALNDPYHNLMTIGVGDFLINPATTSIITDTHYDNPDRRGRQTAFLAHLLQETGTIFYGIGVDEYTAVCIDENRIAHIYGSYPDYDDYAYFLQPNCVLPNTPEVCADGEDLTWDREDAALKVIRIPGTEEGSGTVDLNDWKSVSGDDWQWQNWWVEDGEWYVSEEAAAIDCAVGVQSIGSVRPFALYPQPASASVSLQSNVPEATPYAIYDLFGRLLLNGSTAGAVTTVDLSGLAPGSYMVILRHNDQNASAVLIKQ